MDYLQIPTGDPVLDRHLQHVQNVNWASTPLGPLDQWPHDISMIIHLMMIEPNPRLLLLGKDNNMLYNPAYGEMAGELHPRLLGMPVLEGWPAQAHVTTLIQQTIFATGRVHVQDEVPFTYRRNGALEEVLLRWSTLPLRCSFGGSFVTLTDVTEARTGERRRFLLKEISEGWSLASNVSSLWTKVARDMQAHDKEFPFVITYSASAEDGSGSVREFVLDAQESSRFILKDFVGDGSARSLLASYLDIENEKGPVAECMRQAVASKEVRLLQVADGAVPEAWISAAKSRGHGDDLIAAVICPIKSNRTANIVGLLITGLNTRTPWNEAYRSWITDLGREINDSLTSLLLAEDAARTRQHAAKQAAQEQMLLEKELALSQRQAIDANHKTARLLRTMEGSDVGIFEYSPEGKLTYANVSVEQISRRLET